MRALAFEVLLDWILRELEARQSIFGIPCSLFYVPRQDTPYSISNLLGHFLSTPIGPAAGPHTQLAQNIVSAWLCGGRFIELKTVQIQDQLDIPRPCIDMADEGYNVEWSQELRLDQSAAEYIKAWALIHILHRLLGYENTVKPGTIFNMSVGYDLEGIRSEPMTHFMDRMADASTELSKFRAVLQTRLPGFADIEIPACVADSVTLSTMHGCPPDEIERIARYLLENRGLHTTIKLNPTLLGKEVVAGALHETLGFHEIQIPDEVFARELKYGQAVELIRSLKQAAAHGNRTFGIKLSNTLPIRNHKAILPGTEMYMSGRALYPLAINLLHRLAEEYHGDLNVSYSGGADALNVTEILASGARPVTAASDLLKPGGCTRFLQYLENLEAEMRKRGAASLDELAQNKLANLGAAAADALKNPRYQKPGSSQVLPKVDSGLELFDCIAAPCIEQCAVHQDIPEYTRLIVQGEYDRALEVILAQNPLPGVTGYVCTQLCRVRCTRSASNYDEPVSIRALKRYAAENGRSAPPAAEKHGRRVAVIGSGPSGLSAAYFLALSGTPVTIFEMKDVAGGMMRLAPAFRLPSTVIQQDIDRIVRFGVEIRLNQPVLQPPEQFLSDGFDAVYVASGFQKSIPLYIEGIEGEGVIAALDLLQQVRNGQRVEIGPRVLVIGGGNTAMDAARVAQRLTGPPVTVVYRRTREEMPARREDREGALEEGIRLEELVSPIGVIRRDGKVAALACIRNKSGAPGADGRRRPVPLEGSEFRIEADSIIVAVGQSPDLTFLRGSAIHLHKDGSIAVDADSGYAGTSSVYAGGDAVRGPESIIAACADGRRAAEAICAEFGIELSPLPARQKEFSANEVLQIQRARARREAARSGTTLPPGRRDSFDLIEETLSETAARSEAARCLQCSSFCDKCVEVCPNRANLAYQISPASLGVPVISCRNGAATVVRETAFLARQSRQIIHLHDLCNECGNCATFCVHMGKPYREKPRFFFNASEFEKETDNAFRMEGTAEEWILRRRHRGKELRLVVNDAAGELAFESDMLRAVFARTDFRLKSIDSTRQFPGELSLLEAAEMFVIAKGVIASLPFLPRACES